MRTAARTGGRGRGRDRRADRGQPAPQRFPAPTVVFDSAAAQREIDAVLPDVILLDWMLPGESGLSLAGKRWRAAERTKPVPIIC